MVPKDQDFTSVGSRRKLPQEDKKAPGVETLEDQDFTSVGSRRKLPHEGSGGGVGGSGGSGLS